MNCINVMQDKEQWLAVMNMVLIPLSSINCEFLGWLKKLLASEQGLCYMLLMCTVTKEFYVY
jgi:hypothetical protein